MSSYFRNPLKIFLSLALLGFAISQAESREWINPYWIQVFGLASIVSISALGLNIIYGYTGLFSLAHAAFYGIGAYASACLMKGYGGESQAMFLLSLAGAGAIAAVAAFLIGLPTLRLTSDYLGIATLGFGVIMKVVFDNADSWIPMMGGARGMTGIARMTSVPWVVGALGVAIFVTRNFGQSSFGRALVAIREDEIAASTMGIDVFRYKMIGFVTGCAFAGVAGGLYAHLYVFLHPSNFDFFKSVDVLMIVVLGGLGNMSGTLVAAFGWIFLLEILRVVLPGPYIEYRWVLIPMLLIATMLLRPQGLFGTREFPFLRSGINK